MTPAATKPPMANSRARDSTFAAVEAVDGATDATGGTAADSVDFCWLTVAPSRSLLRWLARDGPVETDPS